MSTRLRPITDADHDLVLGWNADHVELLAPLDAARLHRLLAWGAAGWVIEAPDPAGFVITFTAGSAYDSSNYRWFAARHPAFLYLDRVVVDPAVRRSGIGTAVYDALEEQAAALGPVLCLEVNLDPPNEPSLAFHRARGYEEVGQDRANGHLVSLMEKQLWRTIRA